jgi:hypothetical protein
VAPGGRDLSFLMQRAGGSLPRGDPAFRSKVRRALVHHEALLRYGVSARMAPTAYEFGAGWDLVVPLVYYALGIERQILTDARPNLRLGLVNDAIARLELLRDELSAEAGLPLRAFGSTPLRTIGELQVRFGMEYRAPIDARRTGLPSECIGFASSTNTLEHIPEAELRPVLAETRRLLMPAGVLSCWIDLRDHYSYCDRSISAYNFLTVSDRRWRAVNSALHYQNRLRCSDYRRAFEDAGFAILLEQPVRPTDAELELLSGLRLAPRFRDYALDDLGVKAVTVVATPAAARSAASDRETPAQSVPIGTPQALR